MSNTIYYHKHHIIPKHIGGTDDPSNLVKLTVPEHAEAHKKLYEQYGRWQDKMAYQGLEGLIGKDDIWKEIYRQNGLKRQGYKFPNDTASVEKRRQRTLKVYEENPEVVKKISKSLHKFYKSRDGESSKKKMSDRMKQRYANGYKHTITEKGRESIRNSKLNVPRSIDTKNKIKQTQIDKGLTVSINMFDRNNILVRSFVSLIEAANYFNLTISTISKAVKKGHYIRKGYRFERK